MYHRVWARTLHAWARVFIAPIVILDQFMAGPISVDCCSYCGVDGTITLHDVALAYPLLRSPFAVERRTSCTTEGIGFHSLRESRALSDTKSCDAGFRVLIFFMVYAFLSVVPFKHNFYLTTICKEPHIINQLLQVRLYKGPITFILAADARGFYERYNVMDAD